MRVSVIDGLMLSGCEMVRDGNELFLFSPYNLTKGRIFHWMKLGLFEPKSEWCQIQLTDYLRWYSGGDLHTPNNIELNIPVLDIWWNLTGERRDGKMVVKTDNSLQSIDVVMPMFCEHKNILAEFEQHAETYEVQMYGGWFFKMYTQDNFSPQPWQDPQSLKMKVGLNTETI